jgi:ankyrin repeat protein
MRIKKIQEIYERLCEYEASIWKVLVRDKDGSLPIHVALHYGAPLEVIQLLLDHDIEKKTLLVKAFGGSLSFHIACVT